MNENNYVTQEQHEAEKDTLLIAIDANNKRVDDLRDNVNRNFTVLSIAMGMLAILMAGIQVAVALLIFYLTR